MTKSKKSLYDVVAELAERFGYLSSINTIDGAIITIGSDVIAYAWQNDPKNTLSGLRLYADFVADSFVIIPEMQAIKILTSIESKQELESRLRSEMAIRTALKKS